MIAEMQNLVAFLNELKINETGNLCKSNEIAARFNM